MRNWTDCKSVLQPFGGFRRPSPNPLPKGEGTGETAMNAIGVALVVRRPGYLLGVLVAALFLIVQNSAPWSRSP